jgi:serine phosphatase RsbU (regulator of sigma subunit)
MTYKLCHFVRIMDTMKDVKELLRSIRHNEQAVKEHKDELMYAGILQQGLLPRERHFDRVFEESFCIYKPKNYVSGDFYWIGEKNGIRYFASADCTGHGVPAAMLSVLGYSLLNYALYNADLVSPSDILKKVDCKFIESFDFEGAIQTTNDWIDMSICAYDSENRKLTFCGANRKALVISEKSSQVLPGNRYPIGGWQLEEFRRFEEYTIDVEPGSWVYLGSDGYQDQFGGLLGKKFGSKKLHMLLKSISKLDSKCQKDFLLEHLSTWQSNREQTDDICLLGIKIN